ncbi:MAG: hypothetical protein QM743_01525 [Chitinophagaceae bacterium]
MISGTLYIDTRTGDYRRPQNVGKQVNTEEDEQLLHTTIAARANCSSLLNGWVTMGGFDIYSATGGPSRYTNVQTSVILSTHLLMKSISLKILLVNLMLTSYQTVSVLSH